MSLPVTHKRTQQASHEVLSNPSTVTTPHVVTVEEPLTLVSTRQLPGYIVNFETYGTLSSKRDNAILVCHSLTKDAHAAGRHTLSDERPGWWDAAIGPGRMLDTATHFVICSDALGSGGSTGPRSLNPATGRSYGLDFPVVTVRDMVRVQKQLLDYLGIDCLRAVVGGCLGGQQALEWVVSYPQAVRNAIVITTTPATSAHTIAIFSVMRRLIRADPDWNGGHYYGGVFPRNGLSSAIAAAIPLWMSREVMEARFGSRAGRRAYSYSLEEEFKVEEFINQLADQTRTRLDPNSLMYLMRAVEYFDLEHEYGSLEQAFAEVTARVLFVSYCGDWRYPPGETRHLHEALRAVGGDSRHAVLKSRLGHGAFLYEVESLASEVKAFLAEDDPLHPHDQPAQPPELFDVPS